MLHIIGYGFSIVTFFTPSLKASLAKIQNHLDRLKQHYDDNVQERENLKERKVVTAQRLLRASVLINALADEEVNMFPNLCSSIHTFECYVITGLKKIDMEIIYQILLNSMMVYIPIRFGGKNQ